MYFILSICTVFILTACYEPDSKHPKNNNVTIKKDETMEEKESCPYDEMDFNRPLTNTEKMMLDHNGVLSGIHFNESDLYKQIEQLPPQVSILSLTTYIISF